MLPTLNNLLENREMALDDGRFLMRDTAYDALALKGYEHCTFNKTAFTRALARSISFPPRFLAPPVPGKPRGGGWPACTPTSGSLPWGSPRRPTLDSASTRPCAAASR